MNFFKRIFPHGVPVPLVLLALALVTYGVMLPFTGLYMDDWYILWFKHTFGALEFTRYFAIDRPLEAWFWMAANLLTAGSDSPLVWQIFTFITHFLCAWAFWGFLNALWPGAKRQNTWAACLAVVFPGFTQCWMIQYSFHFTCLALLMLSFTFMLRSLRASRLRWLWAALSLLCGVYAYAGMDFFAGLELIRPVILFIALRQDQQGTKQRLQKTFLHWLPYLLAYLTWIAYRVFLFNSGLHPLTLPGDLRTAPLHTLGQGLAQLYQAGVDAVLGAWSKAFTLASYPIKQTVFWLILLLVVVVFIEIWFRIAKKQNNDEEAIPAALQWRSQALLLSFAGMVTAVLPFWAAGLSIGLQFPSDRFLLAYLPSSCLLLVALLETALPFRKINNLLLALLVAAGAGFQLANGLHYQKLWQAQKDFYWQLVWRMPQLEPGTVLFAWELPDSAYWSGHALTAQLNWTYGETDLESRSIPYQFILLNSGQREVLPSLDADTAISMQHRSYSFSGNTSDSLYLHKGAYGCLRVLDDDLTPADSIIAKLNPDIVQAAALSDLANISGTQANPPLNVLGGEPEHTWCYYFEKAELARQQKDYQLVISLLQLARDNGYFPGVPTEWYPFIEAYAERGDWEEAAARSLQIVNDSSLTHNGVCHLWQRLAVSHASEPKNSFFIQQLFKFDCP